jgi:hypothetical protein
MSQHVVIDEDETKYVYGWDQPLQSFFLQVHDPTLEEDENPLVWLGADHGYKMHEVSELVAAAKRNGLEISYEMQVNLYGEKDDGV